MMETYENSSTGIAHKRFKVPAPRLVWVMGKKSRTRQGNRQESNPGGAS